MKTLHTSEFPRISLRKYSNLNHSFSRSVRNVGSMSSSHCRLYLALFILIITIGCSGQNQDSPVVARVGNQTLTLGEIAVLTSPQEEHSSAVEEREFVRQWIDTEVLYRQALRENLHKDPRLKRVIKQMEKELLAAELMERRMGSQMAIANSEIEEYYVEHRDEFILTRPRVQARHILVESGEKALEIRDRIINGEPFEELVRENTLDTETIITGGDLGLFAENEIDPAIAEAAFSLEEGELSQPVRSDWGYHIIQVTHVQPEGTTLDLDEVRDEIANKIFFSKQRLAFDLLMKELKEDERIEVFWDLIGPETEGNTDVEIKR